MGGVRGQPWIWIPMLAFCFLPFPLSQLSQTNIWSDFETLFRWSVAPRLAIRMILSGSWADLAAMLAPVCSSFSAANQGAAARDLLNGWGNFFHPSISCGNKLMSRTNSCSSKSVQNRMFVWYLWEFDQKLLACVRTILLAVLITVMECLFLLEQPGGSSVLAYPRAKWFIRAMKRIGIPVPWLSESIFLLLLALVELNNSCSSHHSPTVWLRYSANAFGCGIMVEAPPNEPCCWVVSKRLEQWTVASWAAQAPRPAKGEWP